MTDTSRITYRENCVKTGCHTSAECCIFQALRARPNIKITADIHHIMGIVQFIKDKREFLLPDKERLMLFFSFLGFLPFPSYFVAGSGLIPAFYTAIVVLAFIVPRITGLALILMLIYISLMPVVLYLLVSVLSWKIKNSYLKWGIVLALIMISCFVKIYLITDTRGFSATYTAIELYREVL